MITFTTPKHHWNYFLAIEKNLETVSRFVEFADDNKETYSIEFAYLLLSASSEVDVILKQFCKLLDNSTSPDNINQYRAIIKQNCPRFANEEIVIERYGLKYKPWINWVEDNNPIWWNSYNKVKHERNTYFNKANLQNTVNAVGGLLIAVLYFYKHQFEFESGNSISFKEATFQLQPQSNLIRINNSDYYYDYAVI